MKTNTTQQTVDDGLLTRQCDEHSDRDVPKTMNPGPGGSRIRTLIPVRIDWHEN